MGRSSRILIGGAVALLAAAALVVLLVRSSGGDHARRAAPARKATPPVRRHVRKSPSRRRVPLHGNARPRPKPKQRPARPAPLPIAGATTTPWRTDGTSYVASSRHRWLAVYSRPHVQHPSLFLRNPDRIGSPRTLLVHTRRKAWVRVYLPQRPNESTGWIRSRAVTVLRNPYRVDISLHSHRLELWNGEQRVLQAQTVVGKPSTPTPVGMFFIVDLMRQPDPHGSYGPFAFNLSAHSRVLFHFAGGDGVVAIHGTNEPGLLGESASHGCVRVSNPVIRRLARVLPLGTPVRIRR